MEQHHSAFHNSEQFKIWDLISIETIFNTWYQYKILNIFSRPVQILNLFLNWWSIFSSLFWISFFFQFLYNFFLPLVLIIPQWFTLVFTLLLLWSQIQFLILFWTYLSGYASLLNNFWKLLNKKQPRELWTNIRRPMLQCILIYF